MYVYKMYTFIHNQTPIPIHMYVHCTYIQLKIIFNKHSHVQESYSRQD